MLTKQGVEAMLQILGKILHRIYPGRHIRNQLLLVSQQFIQRCPAETVACPQVQILPERKPSQVIALHYILQLWILLLQPHHAAAGKDYLQSGIHVVA